MPAAIASDGARDLFASFREVAWHGLGTVFQNEVTDSRVMLDLAGLAGWDVRKVAMDLPGIERWVKTHEAVVANIGGQVVGLGITGERYTIVSNEDAFAFLQSFSDGARWETAGALKGGRQVFGSLAFDREVVLDPNGVADKVKTYALVVNTHDGSGSMSSRFTPVRVVCANTLAVAMGDCSEVAKFRHTGSIAERMAQEAEAIRARHAYFDAFEVEAQALMAQKVTDDQFFGIVNGIVPMPETNVKGAQTKAENARGLFAQAWQGEPNAGIRGTGWGAWNALTEANQWGRNTQNTANGAENFAAAGAGFDGPTNKFRADALAMVKSLV